MTTISNVTIIGRKHTKQNRHVCVTPTLYTFINGFKMFYDIKGKNKAIFLNTTNWFWLPTAGFYGIFEIRQTELALVDFYDYTTFDEELTNYVDYLAGY